MRSIHSACAHRLVTAGSVTVLTASRSSFFLAMSRSRCCLRNSIRFFFATFSAAIGPMRVSATAGLRLKAAAAVRTVGTQAALTVKQQVLDGCTEPNQCYLLTSSPAGNAAAMEYTALRTSASIEPSATADCESSSCCCFLICSCRRSSA